MPQINVFVRFVGYHHGGDEGCVGPLGLTTFEGYEVPIKQLLHPRSDRYV
jgi:hypothetical protein